MEARCCKKKTEVVNVILRLFDRNWFPYLNDAKLS